jgi:hypothetical protein
MKLQDQVCSLEQAKKLKELGILQTSSHFQWVGDENHIPEGETSPWVWVDTTAAVNSLQQDHRDNIELKFIASAFTVAEIGMMLPDNYGTWLTSSSKSGDRVFSTFQWTPIMDHPKVTANVTTATPAFKSEAFARAELLIWLLEKQALTISKINQLWHV